MRRIFSNPVTALIAGLALRLLFVLRFPASSGDTVLYEQMATNWLKHGLYAMDVSGAIQPVDLRMPGYPAYLALVYCLTGKTGAAAQVWVMLGQVAVDLAACVAVAALAGVLASAAFESLRSGKRTFTAALWLGALCPFTANYTAVPLTETFAIALTGAAILLPAAYWTAVETGFGVSFGSRRMSQFVVRGIGNGHENVLALTGLLVGLATLFRPESPLILIAVWITLRSFVVRERGSLRGWLRLVALSGFTCALPLIPWAVRNYVTLHEVQFLAPKNSNLPGELVPYGFMAWEKTWLFRMKDCYLVPWKLNGEAINVEDVPARAFDTPEEKERVSAILEQYNEDLTLSAEEDNAFGQLAKERTARHPLRTHLWLPALRAVTMWFTPRIELLPVSGQVFPLRQQWEDDKVDQSVTAGLFLLNIAYVGLAISGAATLWRNSPAARAAVALLVLYLVLRTAFLTTLETPEPRYTLEGYPAIIAFAAVALAGRKPSGEIPPAERCALQRSSSGSG